MRVDNRNWRLIRHHSRIISLDNLISNNLTLDKNMFQKRRETLSDECFIVVTTIAACDFNAIGGMPFVTVTGVILLLLFKI